MKITTTPTPKELEEEWYKNQPEQEPRDKSFPTLLPIARKISATTLGSGGWVQSEKQQLKENRINKLRQLKGEAPNVKLPKDEFVDSLVSVKPLSSPIELFYMDYVYEIIKDPTKVNKLKRKDKLKYIDKMLMIKKFNFFNDNASYFDKFFHLKMKEGLIHSFDYELFIEKLNNTLKNENINYNITQKNEYVELYINLTGINHKKIDKQLYQIIHTAGYFISNLIDIKENKKIKSILNSKNNEFLIYFQKRFDIPKNIPKRLFHSTTKQYYEKIKRTGLTTKTQKMISDDLERLYFTDNLAEAIDFCTQKRFFYKNKYRDIRKFDMNIDKWVVLEIDIFSIPDIKLYKDEKMDNSYYTYDFIPFYAIKIEKEINF